MLRVLLQVRLTSSASNFSHIHLACGLFSSHNLLRRYCGRITGSGRRCGQLVRLGASFSYGSADTNCTICYWSGCRGGVGWSLRTCCVNVERGDVCYTDARMDVFSRVGYEIFGDSEPRRVFSGLSCRQRGLLMVWSCTPRGIQLHA